jgi:NADH-quinone oxidoreductase subunit C
MMADLNDILTLVKSRFESEIISVDTSSDIPSIVVSSSSVYTIIEFLKNDKASGYEFLTDLCGIHYPEKELSLGVVYHMHNLAENKRIRVKTFVPQAKPEVSTITPLFSAANWMERETYDFYGIIFTDHPNLKRILNVEFLDFFPMRKEYPLEDPTREDKDNRFFGR